MISVWELRSMTDAGLVFLLQFLFFFFSFTFHDLVCVWFRLSKDMKDWWTEAVGTRVMVVSMVSVYLSVVVSAWRWIILYLFFLWNLFISEFILRKYVCFLLGPSLLCIPGFVLPVRLPCLHVGEIVWVWPRSCWCLGVGLYLRPKQ